MTTLDLLSDRSLPRRWAAVLGAEPSRPVVYDDESGWVSREELEAASRSFARSLADAGLEPGDRIVMSSAPSVSLAVAHVAALRLGLVVVPMNTAYTRREIEHVVADSAPAAVAADEERRARLVADARGGAPLVTVRLAPGSPPSIEDSRSRAAGTADPDLDTADAEDPALLVYTSGTTGAPKGALLSHGNLLASAEAVRLAWHWTEEDRLVLPLPLFHVHGLAVGLHGTLAAGGSVVLRRRADPADLGAALEEHAATMLFSVPTIYARLAGERRLSPLRLCVSGSAPLPAGLHRRIEGATGQRILERYGMTEALMIASNPYEGERRPGTVGFPLPGVQLRIDAEGGGEVLVRGPNVFSGYWRRADATAAAFEGGWFRTGDVGELDADGYLRLTARKSELIITGGYNVYPREVEDVLRGHPAVLDAAVVGWPDPEWGEQVVAFVVTDGPVAEPELLALAAEQLAPYKRPRRIVQVRDLPRNALGKVVKSELGPPAG